MPTRKMRVELFDGEGNRYTIAFEGNITRDKAVRLLDMAELLGGIPPTGVNTDASHAIQVPNDLSKFDKVQLLAQKSLPLIWFSSKEVQLAYEQEFREPITQSTVATYLSRLVNKGLLSKAGSPNNLKYKLIPPASQVAPDQKKL